MTRKSVNVFISAFTVFVCLGLIFTYFFILKSSASAQDKLAAESNLLIGKNLNLNQFERLEFSDIPLKSINSNRKILVVYLLSGCAACKKEVVAIESSGVNSGSQTLVVGLMAEDEDVIRKYARENKITFPIFSDKGGSLIKALNLKYFPSNFIVENNEIKDSFFGYSEEQNVLSKLSLETLDN